MEKFYKKADGSIVFSAMKSVGVDNADKVNSTESGREGALGYYFDYHGAQAKRDATKSFPASKPIMFTEADLKQHTLIFGPTTHS